MEGPLAEEVEEADEAKQAEGALQPGVQAGLQAADLEPLLASFKQHKESDLASPARLAAVYDAITADGAPCGHAHRTHSAPSLPCRVEPRSTPARVREGHCTSPDAEGRRREGP